MTALLVKETDMIVHGKSATNLFQQALLDTAVKVVLGVVFTRFVIKIQFLLLCKGRRVVVATSVSTFSFNHPKLVRHI